MKQCDLICESTGYSFTLLLKHAGTDNDLLGTGEPYNDALLLNLTLQLNPPFLLGTSHLEGFCTESKTAKVCSELIENGGEEIKKY